MESQLIWDTINYVMSAVGIIGNILVIIFFLKYKRRTRLKQLSSYHFLIVQLAVTDLLVCITKQLFRVTYRYSPAYQEMEFDVYQDEMQADFETELYLIFTKTIQILYGLQLLFY